MMFAELAISPSVFLAASFAAPEVCDAHLSGLKDVLLNYTLTRDLRNGDFCAGVLNSNGLHKRGKELLNQMRKQRRLVPFPAVLPAGPETAADWILEAMGSHQKQPLIGMLSCAAVKAAFPNPLVVDVARRTGAVWWQEIVSRSSWAIPRTTEAYQELLSPLYRHANSIRFIDPHLDPTRKGYSRFGELLLPMKGRVEVPLIEIHRVCSSGSGPAKTILQDGQIRAMFSDLSELLNANGLGATVFVWSEGHDRHILTDLGGFVLGNGLDTSTTPDSSVTWSRIDRATQEKIARRHDPNVNAKELRDKFTIGV